MNETRRINRERMAMVGLALIVIALLALVSVLALTTGHQDDMGLLHHAGQAHF